MPGISISSLSTIFLENQNEKQSALNEAPYALTAYRICVIKGDVEMGGDKGMILFQI
jgi:hypothetical protein